MSKKTEEAKAFFKQGFNCSQAVAAVFARQYGLDQNAALKIGCGFGAGMRNGEVCGAVAGAVMVIGLKYGVDSTMSQEQKGICYNKTVEFTNAFREKNGSILCRELLECDISKEEGMKKAIEKNLFKTTCVDMIIDAVALLEKLGY